MSPALSPPSAPGPHLTHDHGQTSALSTSRRCSPRSRSTSWTLSSRKSGATRSLSLCPDGWIGDEGGRSGGLQDVLDRLGHRQVRYPDHRDRGGVDEVFGLFHR